MSLQEYWLQEGKALIIMMKFLWFEQGNCYNSEGVFPLIRWKNKL